MLGNMFVPGLGCPGECGAGGIASVPGLGPGPLQAATSCNPLPNPHALITYKLEFFWWVFFLGGDIFFLLNSSWKAAPQPVLGDLLLLGAHRLPQLAYLTPGFFCSAKIPVRLPALTLLEEGGRQADSAPKHCTGDKSRTKKGSEDKRLFYEVFSINLMPLRKGK